MHGSEPEWWLVKRTDLLAVEAVEQDHDDTLWLSRGLSQGVNLSAFRVAASVEFG